MAHPARKLHGPAASGIATRPGGCDSDAAAGARKLRILQSAVHWNLRGLWRAFPTCIECHQAIGLYTSGAPVITDEGPRLAHRHRCFARAMLRHHPTLFVRAAVCRAQEDSER